MIQEIGRYDPYTDKFINNTTLSRIEVGTDGNLYRLSVSNGNEYYIHPPKDEYNKADMVAMLEELKYELYHALCHEIHDKEDCPCTNQSTSCLATFSRVCDVNSTIGKVIQQKIDKLKENI